MSKNGHRSAGDRDGTAESASLDDASGIPLAMIHKRILDFAEDNPEAAVETIATHVSGASLDLVERVLDNYGDPAEDKIHEKTQEGKGPKGDSRKDESPEDDQYKRRTSSSQTTPRDLPPAESLSAQQQDILRAISDNPRATQQDLAELFDVSSATINRRLNSINGFDWSDRVVFAEDVLPDGGATGVQTDTTIGVAQAREGEFHLESRSRYSSSKLAVNEARDMSPGQLTPELIHNVMRLCITSERISRSEERQILSILLEDDDGG